MMPVAIRDSDLRRAQEIMSPSGHIAHQIATAIAFERERCAQVAEHLNGWGKKPSPDLANHIAAVIRRGT